MKFEAAALDAAGGKTIEGAKWTWDFGDGTTSASNPATHAWDKPGKYQVTATANLAGSKASDSLTVKVLQQLDPEFTLELDPAAATVADPWDVKLIGPGTNDVSYVEIEHTWHRCSGEEDWVEQPGCIGEWTLAESTPEYRLWTTYWMTWACHNFPADTYVEVYWVGYGMPPPDGHAETNTVTATPDNTVIKADPAQGIIKYDPDSQDPTIDWTITHLDPTPDGTPVFDVQVQICGLSGSVLHDVTVEQTGEGAGEYEWDGTCNQMMPPGDQASKGVYTFKLAATHQPYPHYYCGDDDKSAALEVSIDNFYYFRQDPLAGTLKVIVRYTLNRDAGDAYIKFFDPELVEIGSLTEQDSTSGTHWSEECELSGVEFDENDNPVEPLYCVVYAEETGADAVAYNRDHVPKPALQNGRTEIEELMDLDSATLIDPPLTEAEEESPGAYVHYNIDNDDDSDNSQGEPKHPGWDLPQEEVAGEDDLMHAWASFDPDIQWGKVTLRRESVDIRVWTSPTKGQGNELLVDVPEKTWDLSVQAEYDDFHATKPSLYVEGATYGGVSDLTLRFERPDDSVICEHIVHYTAIAADCGNQPRTVYEYWYGASQRAFFEQTFPLLVRCEWSHTAPRSEAYNCIAWSIGDTEHWYNQIHSVPPHIVGIDEEYGDDDGTFEIEEDLDAFYDWYGYSPTAAGPADATIMYYDGYHAARKRTCSCGEGQWIMYESKCGRADRIEHVHDQLDGSGYGQRIRFYE